MRSMKAPMSISDINVRHVAMAVSLLCVRIIYYYYLQHKYIRTLEDWINFCWINFRKWINLYYPDQDTIDWVEILSEDEATVLPTPPLHDQLYCDTDGEGIAKEVFSDNYIGVQPICRDATDISRWRPTLKYSKAYIFALLHPSAL